MLTQDEALLIELGIIAHALDIVLKKRHDYSGTGDPFKNLRLAEGFGVDSIVGCIIRESDKNSRIVSLIGTDLASSGGCVGESLIDTFSDKINYTGIEAGLYAERDTEFKRSVMAMGRELKEKLNV